jgi:hypothetical protein
MLIPTPATVTPEEPLAYARDASCWNNPSTNGAKYYHRARPDVYATAACSARIALVHDGVAVRMVNGLLCIRCFGARRVTITP